MVGGRVEHIGGWAHLNDAPAVHDQDVLGYLTDHEEIVGDENQAQAA
jgi:hypothetical protein